MSSTFHDVRPLTSPVYASLGDVGRSLHWDDVQMTYAQRMLIPQRFSNTNVAAVRNKMVLWIAPVSRTVGSNFFGNVTFISDWPSILEKFGPNLYHVDQSIHNRTGHTRVLLTSSTYWSLEKVDFHTEGSAVIERDCQLLHAKESVCKNGVQGLHQLQIAIETDVIGGEWLYARCRVEVEDHSDVNHEVRKRNCIQRKRGLKLYQSYKCFKFNTAQGKPCPYMLSATCTKTILASQCPELSNRIDISESDTTKNKPNRIDFVESNTIDKKMNRSDVVESNTIDKKMNRSDVVESNTIDKKMNRSDVVESNTIDKKMNRSDVVESDINKKKPNPIDVAEPDTSDRKPILIDVAESVTGEKKSNRIEKKTSKQTQTLVVYDDFDFESIRSVEEFGYDDETYQFDYFEFEDQDIWNNDDDFEQELIDSELDYDDAQEFEPETVDDYEQEQFESEPDYDDAQEVVPETVDDYEQEQFESEPDYHDALQVELETVDDFFQELFESEQEYQDDQDFKPETPLDPYELELELETFVPDDDVYNELEEHQFDTERDFDDDYYEQDNYYSEY